MDLYNHGLTHTHCVLLRELETISFFRMEKSKCFLYTFSLCYPLSQHCPLVPEKAATKHFTSYLIAILFNVFLVYRLLVVSAGPNW